MAAQHDLRPHRETYEKFMKLAMRGSVAAAVVLLLMLIFLV